MINVMINEKYVRIRTFEPVDLLLELLHGSFSEFSTCLSLRTKTIIIISQNKKKYSEFKTISGCLNLKKM